MKPYFLRPRASRLGTAGAAVLLALPLAGCTSVKALKPAFETNQKNLAELQANVVKLVALVEITGHAVIDMQIEARRTAVCASLQENLSELGFDPTKVTDQAVDALLRDPNKTAGRKYLDFSSAIAAADPSRRKELQLQQPVFAARLTLEVSSQQLADDYAMLLNASKTSNVAQLRAQIATKYPTVKELVAGRVKFDSDMAQYRKVVIQDQLGLALEHAELFNYAAQGNLNIEKAFASVIGDKGLQTQILGFVTDPRTRSALSESFDFITELTTQPR